MRAHIPINIQQVWQLYNCTEVLLNSLWETYGDDFLDYYFPEVTGQVVEPDPAPGFETEDFNSDDIPF